MDMMTKFIVLSGKKQAGKTVSANFFKAELEARGKSVHITSFASPIKDFCTDVIGLTHEQVYGSNEDKQTPTHIMWDTMPAEIRYRYSNTKEEFAYLLGVIQPITKPTMRSGPMTAREVMQILGTDIFRNFFDFDIWAKAPFKKYVDSAYDFVIIDDCRFPNEADMSLKYNAILIRLQRDVLGDDVHISEKALDSYPQSKYTAVIDNNNYVDIVTLFTALNALVTQHRIA